MPKAIALKNGLWVLPPTARVRGWRFGAGLAFWGEVRVNMALKVFGFRVEDLNPKP